MVEVVEPQRVYCAGPWMDGVEVDPVYVPNAGPVYLGSLGAGEGLHQMEYHVLPPGAQISAGEPVGLMPQSVHGHGELFQGSIVVERGAGHGVCVAEERPVSGKCHRKMQKRKPETPGSETSGSDVLAQAPRVDARCDVAHCHGLASDDTSQENEGVANEATLCMNLANCAQSASQRECVDFDFSALVEVARCEETCKHTGRKSGSSHFLGVSKHRKSGRFEAHVWMPEKSRQAYLGGFKCAMAAACAYDIVAIKVKGDSTTTNFRKKLYSPHSDWIQSTSLEEIIAHIRRHSGGFSRGHSKYRGVTQHPNGRWEARIGVGTKSHIYLGLYKCQQSAAKHYDEALVRLKGLSAATNFPLRGYSEQIAENRAMMSKSTSGELQYPLMNRKTAVEWIKHGNSQRVSQVKKCKIDKH